MRKAKIDKENEEKRLAKEQEKAFMKASGGYMASRKVYKNVGANRGLEEGEDGDA